MSRNLGENVAGAPPLAEQGVAPGGAGDPGPDARVDDRLPLVYSCSGASSAAQLANHLAVKLDRLNLAEMSCIAGVGGDVKPLVRIAMSGRPIIALDGCPLHCVAHILKRHGLRADKHYDLSRLGVQKRKHEDFDPQEAERLLTRIREELVKPADNLTTDLPLQSATHSGQG